MKALFGQLAMLQENRTHGRNLRFFGRVVIALTLVILLFMVIFRVLMAREGQETSWVTAFYWVLTVMSTLGFGDINFHTDLGRFFSMIVLIVGMLMLLVLLPFLFIEMFYLPWSAAREARRVPRELDEEISGHVLITSVSVTVEALRRKLEALNMPYYLLLGETEEAQRYYDLGWNVIHGDHDRPESWIAAGVKRAALVAATGEDPHNAHVAFTVREVNPEVPVVAIANEIDSVDVLQLAGATEVVRLSERLGQALARRVTGIDTVSHPVGELNGLIIAEANARNTELPGQTLKESDLRRAIGVSAVGLWEQGRFRPAAADLVINEESVLLLVGTREQFDRYDRAFRSLGTNSKPVLILGGGRVGRATARALAAGGLDYRIVEKVKGRAKDPGRVVIGNAADLAVLKEAGLDEASAIILTTHDDDMNVFLTIYCRKLRPEVQILSRSTRTRNVPTLYRAGADLVLSYASMGADAIYHHLDSSSVLTIAEGLTVNRFDIPKSLAGKTLAESQLRPLTGASVIAVETCEGRILNPDPFEKLPSDGRLVLMGDSEAEKSFAKLFLLPEA